MDDIDLSFLEDYRHRVVKWGDILLFPADVAVEAVGDFKYRDIRLLGLDAFDSSTEDKFGRRDDDCLDFSRKEYWDYSVEELCDIATEHIQFRNDLLFEFIEP
jgi:hypothetical protein